MGGLGSIYQLQETARKLRAVRSSSGKSQGIMSSHSRWAACWPCDWDSHFPSPGTACYMRSCPPGSAVCKHGASVEADRQSNQGSGSFLPSPSDKEENTAPLPEPRRIL